MENYLNTNNQEDQLEIALVLLAGIFLGLVIGLFVYLVYQPSGSSLA